VKSDAELLSTLDRILDQVLDRAEPERLAFVRGLPAEYDPVRSRLLALLVRAAERGSPLDRPPRVLPEADPDGSPEDGDHRGGGPPAMPETEPGLLTVGDRLGRYQIRGVLGVGGMGRVYRALDPVLGREVALKTLSRAFHPDAAGLRQVEREARILATLSHPNVGAIYGLEELDGAPCLVLELVEGETLARRLERGPLPLSEAAAVAEQVAAALEEAHRRGIVHRDLKPANVKVGPGGRVKVIDFGIARALAPLEEPAAPLTESAGPVSARGTVPYMSPEQIRGEPIDARADVWAFGCLFYEMLAGQRAFRGSAAPEVVAAVLRDPVRWEALPPLTPRALLRLLRRCLARDQEARLRSIGDARLELLDLDPEELQPVSAVVRRAAPWVLGGAALLALALAVAMSRGGPSPPVAQLSLELPADLPLAGGLAAPFALSPDGTWMALVVLKDGVRHLAIRSLSSLEVKVLPQTEGAWEPTFSPDGHRVAFFAQRMLKTIDLRGGPALSLAEVGDVPRGASWGADGQIVFAPTQVDGLSQVPEGGGPVTVVTRVDADRGEGSHRWPQVLPGGRWLLFTVGLDGESFDDARIEVVSRRTGERRLVMPRASQGIYALGHLFFVREGQLQVVPFDPGSARVRGTPGVLAEVVRYDPRNGGAHFAVSDGGQLLYRPGDGPPPDLHLAWVDSAGRLARLAGPPRKFREPRLSPDGRRVAVVVGSPPEADLWLLQVNGGALTRLTFGLSPRRPTWKPDGSTVTVSAERSGRWLLLDVPASGGATSTLLESSHRLYPDAWTPDGRTLVYEELRPETGWDLVSVEVGPGGVAATTHDLFATPFQERKASLSPDGRLVAFESNELDGVNGVFVSAWQRPETKTRATATFANWPRWGSDGRLYYWYASQARTGDSSDPEGVYGVDLNPSGSPDPGAGHPAPLWPGGPKAQGMTGRLVVGPYAGFDVDGAGEALRVLALEGGDEVSARAPSPVLVVGLAAKLKHAPDAP